MDPFATPSPPPLPAYLKAGAGERGRVRGVQNKISIA